MKPKVQKAYDAAMEAETAFQTALVSRYHAGRGLGVIAMKTKPTPRIIGWYAQNVAEWQPTNGTWKRMYSLAYATAVQQHHRTFHSKREIRRLFGDHSGV